MCHMLKEVKSDCKIKILSYILGMSLLTFCKDEEISPYWSSKKPTSFYFPIQILCIPYLFHLNYMLCSSQH